MGYYDPPEDYICGICKDVDCNGCPGFEDYVDEGEPQWIWEDDANDDGLTRQQAIDIATDIIAERDAKDESIWIVATYVDVSKN
jgi:hypothetical protein